MPHIPRKLLLVLLLLLAPALQAFEQQPGRPALHVVYFQDYPPLSSGAGDKVHGALIDLLDEVLGKRMGVALQHGGYPWVRAQRMVRDGQADAFVTLHTRERQTYTLASQESVFASEMRFYASRKHPELARLQGLTTLEQFRPYRMAYYLGAGWAREKLHGFKTTRYPLASDMYRAAATLQVDFVGDAALHARRAIRELALDGELIELPIRVDTLHYRLCIRKDSPYAALLPEFDRTLRAMRADGSLAAILARHGL
ncbi:substrate-binding periplasmic protein [Chitinilyticum litopenaei]|uniref:substrate-binding periplasmic protein n=1 Tax=Chitinilyticum litopenaei TaxID=1121276 RepID=UPI0003FA597A|nr:transporter substrate-binding domain-containing protein [Chitinilyticum litopenaei]